MKKLFLTFISPGFLGLKDNQNLSSAESTSKI